MFMKADMHIHTDASHDAKSPIDDICKEAIQKGIGVINISDHFTAKVPSMSLEGSISASVASVRYANERYGDQLKIMSGIEIAESFWNPEVTLSIMEMFPYDSLTCSVHSVKKGSTVWPIFRYNFSASPEDELYTVLDQYFEDTMESLKLVAPDILAHCTYPLRYITNKHGRKVDLTRHMPKYEEIFSYLIRHDIALEVNTAYTAEEGLPERDLNVLRLYRQMGGKLLTLGSDAHVSTNVGHNFAIAEEQLRLIGFEECVYFEKRVPVSYRL